MLPSVVSVHAARGAPARRTGGAPVIGDGHGGGGQHGGRFCEVLLGDQEIQHVQHEELRVFRGEIVGLLPVTATA